MTCVGYRHCRSTASSTIAGSQRVRGSNPLSSTLQRLLATLSVIAAQAAFRSLRCDLCMIDYLVVCARQLEQIWSKASSGLLNRSDPAPPDRAQLDAVQCSWKRSAALPMPFGAKSLVDGQATMRAFRFGSAAPGVRAGHTADRRRARARQRVRRRTCAVPPAGFEPALPPPEAGRTRDRQRPQTSYLTFRLASCVCVGLAGAAVRSTRRSTA